MLGHEIHFLVNCDCKGLHSKDSKPIRM